VAGPIVEDDNEVWPDFRRNPEGRLSRPIEQKLSLVATISLVLAGPDCYHPKRKPSMLSDADIREQLGPIGDPPPPDPSFRSSKPKWIPVLAAVVVLWAGCFALILHLVKISPPIPDPPTNHTWRFNDSRRVVYLTPKEHWTVEAAIAIPVIATLALVFFVLPSKPS
jgi:hypothetical protein